MKKLISLIISISMIITLSTGCSKKDEGKTTEQTAKTETKEEVKAPVDVNFWMMWTNDSIEGVFINKIVDRFNEQNKDVKVILQANTDSDKQIAAITAGNGPDIAQNFWPTLSLWGKQGALEPLDGFIKDTNFDVNDFLPATIQQCSYNNQIVGLPFAAMSGEIYYNKDLLKEAGYENPPETIEELIEMSDKLTKVGKDGTIERMGYLPDFPWLDHVIWPVMFGCNFYDPNTKDAPITEKNYIAAYQWQADIYKKYGPDKIEKFKSGFGTDASHPFITGKLAIMFNGEWMPSTLKKFAPDLNYGIAPIPYPKDIPEQKGAGLVSGGVFYMSAKSENKEPAWKFMSYLHSKEVMTEFGLEGEKRLMTRVSSLEALPKDYILNPIVEVLKGPKARGFAAIPIVNEYITIVNDETQLALKGKVSVEEALKKAKEKVMPLIEKMD